MSEKAEDHACAEYLITNVLIPTDESANSYGKFDVKIANGKIESVVATALPSSENTAGKCGVTLVSPSATTVVIDGTDKMLLPGFVNAHAHSVQQWGRGIIKPLPLELWLEMLYQHIDPRALDPDCPSEMVYLSALHTGVETVMTGGTAIIDHLFVRHLEDVEAAVRAYKQVGLRAYIAPMCRDLDRLNCYPLVPDAKERNAAAAVDGKVPGGLGPEGTFREAFPPRDSAATERILALWEAAVEKFHDPENGINIAIGPVQNWSASDELIKASVDLRVKYDLCGHIHLLESRAQRLQSRMKYPNGGAVKKLLDMGWLSLPGTSLAHCCWLEEEEQRIIAEAGAVVVHNPVSNARLGSGIAPLREYEENGVTIAFGCDGACSNDGQDLLEAIKFGCILNPLTNMEYRKWVTPRDVIRMAAEGGAAAINLKNKAGAIKPGFLADLVLYDLTALSMLPRTDPVGLLVLGRPSSGAGGNAINSVWVGGKLILQDGIPKGVDLTELRRTLMEKKPEYTNPDITDPSGTPFEVEYRAAMGLDTPLGAHDKSFTTGYPQNRLNYPADISK